MKRKKPKGWPNEPQRHSLASKGVQTVLTNDDRKRLEKHSYNSKFNDLKISEIEQLLFIGKNPDASRKDMISELDISEHILRKNLYKLREYGWVVRAPPYDREEGKEWMLTSWGKKKLKDTLGHMDLDINWDSLEVFVPKGER